jgi:hypothetical protein
MLSEHGDIESLTVIATDRAAGSLATRSAARRRVLATVGAAGLVAVLASAFLLAAGAAAHPTIYVPARSGGWPGWLAGPLAQLGVGLDSKGFQALTLIMCAGYLLALAGARRLPRGAIVATIVAADAALLLGPPLLSQDVFGYLSFARMGVLHGLDPYTRVAAEAPTDAVFPFVGWPFQHSPYGPPFTLFGYALVPLGLAGGLWALKATAVLGSLLAVALTARAARRMGASARVAAVFVGLNPVLLELAVGGAHNDTLVLASLAGALALSAAASGRACNLAASDTIVPDTDRLRVPGAATPGRLRTATVALVAGVGVKASAGLVLPFLLLAPARWRERARLLTGAAGALAVLAIVGIAGFGTHALGFLNALGEQQQLVATHSIPAETARWIGLHGTPGWWRDLFAVAFVAALALTLSRTARGADWRAMAGWATLALLLSTAWLLPWYAVWPLPLAALADSRRLRIATLLVCAYAVTIHLPLADPLLSPPRHVGESARPPTHANAAASASNVPLGRVVDDHGVVFARLEVPGHVALDLGG